MSACVLMTCEREAECGPWCRHHWNEQFDRDVALAMQDHSLESLAHAFVIETRRRQFLVATVPNAKGFGECCGHGMEVHTHGGCTGLSGGGQGDHGQDGWYPCPCREWVPYDA